MEQNAVPIDAAGLLWQCALMHSSEYLSGNLLPALIEWTQHLNYFRSICQWKMRLYLDGMNNPHKEFENERRRLRRDSAEHEHGRIRNTPEYLAQAAWIAKNVLKIPCYISKEEADPQVAYEAVSKGLVPVTGDSDLIAYGAVKVILVKSYSRGWYRVIDLEVDTEPGEYPLYDLYKDNGVIVFQLYAGCRGCDFTNEECGIKGIGFTAFMTIASAVEGDLNALTFSKAMWSSDNTKQIAFHHWTDDRLGIDRPPTVDACSWIECGKTLVSDVRAKIHELQSVQHCSNIEAQKEKMERDAKRNVTEGNSSEYVQHDAKQKQNPSSDRFLKKRKCVKDLYEALKEDM